ncbi:Oleosin 1 [Artemisia annua]|uniref:Oleosin 1 n=1 Tax=Artemisia annua TaxID=35608 RepID=A0A2U1L2D6_ARTAN|nr:Oleosin 1 [Artemisia annua]
MDKGEQITKRVDQSAFMTSNALKEHTKTGGRDQHEVLKKVAKFFMSQMFGGVTTSVLIWLFKYVTGEQPRGADTLDQVSHKLASKAREIRDKGEHMTQDLSSKEVMKKATMTMIGSSLIVLSGFTFVGTVLGLILVTPLFVVFSPVLVSVVITVFVFATGFNISGGLGVAGVTVLVWLYMYVTDKHPIGANSLDQMMHKLGLMGQEMREKSVREIEGVGYTNGVEWDHDQESSVK